MRGRGREHPVLHHLQNFLFLLGLFLFGEALQVCVRA